MPHRTSWRLRSGEGGVSQESGHQFGAPAKCVFCGGGGSHPALSPTLSREGCAGGSLFRFSGDPRRTEISSGKPLQALSHYFCFSVLPRQQGAESDCAAPPRPVSSTLIQNDRSRLRPLPRLQSPRPTLPFLGRDLFPVNPVKPQGSWRLRTRVL